MKLSPVNCLRGSLEHDVDVTANIPPVATYQAFTMLFLPRTQVDYIRHFNQRFQALLCHGVTPECQSCPIRCCNDSDDGRRSKRPIQLPVELFRIVAEHCHNDPKTLLSLMLTCRHLKHEGERVLYFAIDAHSQVRFPVTLLQHILSSPRVAGLVHHLSVPELTRRLGTGKIALFRSLVLQVLPTLVHLKSLDLSCWDSTTVSTLISCPFQLRTLKITSWSSSLENGIATFLTRQPELEELDFLATNALQVPPTALPKLKRLSATACSLETFLTGRSVEKVVWVSYPRSEREVDVPLLAESLNNIRSLKLGDKSTPLASFAHHLVRLKHLELQDPSEEDLECVPGLVELQTLTVSFTDADDIHEEKLVKSLFRSQTLDSVDIRQEFVGEQTTRRWYRGQEFPIDV